MLEILNEAIKSFRRKGDSAISPKFFEQRSGEGVEEINIPYGLSTLSSFNLFYRNYIDKAFDSEVEKIREYRRMADMPEISDIIEDIVVEATQENDDGEIFNLDIHEPDLEKNENARKIIYDEFNHLFYNRLKISERLPDLIKTYIVDGRLHYERVINKNRPSDGIVNIKKLPSETMDFDYDPKTGRINYFFQYLKEGIRKPRSIEEAEKDKDIIVFYPEQIGYIDYGVYGKNRKDIKGYLDKVKVPFNQLKLLETSIIIYRIIRAPERLVFKIDTGSMPRDKALKYVEKIKSSMNMRQTYDSATGRLSNEPALLSLLHNFYIPQCLSLSSKIPLLDGSVKTLRDLIDDHNNGITNWVYSVDQNNGSIIPGKISWAGITRRNADLVRVYLDNGEYQDCTPDHKFVMRDGTETEAQHLKEGDSLMPFYTREKRIGVRSNEYLQIYDMNSKRFEFVHRIVGTKYDSRGTVNFNRFNNDPDNLVLMESMEHLKLHVENIKELRKDPEFVRIQADGARNSMNKRFKNPREREKVGNLLRKRWKDKEFRKKIMEIATKPMDDEEKEKVRVSIKRKFREDPEYKKKHHVINHILTHEFGLKNYTEFKNNVVINHKVVKIEKLPHKEDTGCITVEDEGNNHNFALSCGVFVKNSSDGRGSDITSIQGNFDALKVLDDLYYFQKKVYRALRYPISRIQSRNERGEEPLFGGRTMAEISRDEIKWAKFLERKVQNPFENELLELFLLHMEFKGLKKEYGLNRDNMSIKFNDPSFYKSQQQQMFLETRSENYLKLANNQEFSKTYLMKKYLNWSEEEIEENMKALKEDKKLLQQLMPSEPEQEDY